MGGRRWGRKGEEAQCTCRVSNHQRHLVDDPEVI